MADRPVPPQVPYRFERTHAAAEVVARWGGIEAGTETGETVAVAGRVGLSRPQGRVGFAELRDWTGSVQLFALDGTTADFAGFSKLRLGDWIGARGEVMKTRRGELSVRVSEWVLLAEARRGFGYKWRGVTNPEIRYRHREVDLWANPQARRVAQLRVLLLRRLRERLWERGFDEVETPMLHAIPGGALARPFVTHHNALDIDLYLRIAPELYLKRLVVGGLERVFEVGRVFRNEGISHQHNPEFTLLELYQAYADYRDLMVLVEELVSGLALDLLGTTEIVVDGGRIDLAPPWRRATMTELITESAGIKVDVHSPLEDLRRHLRAVGAPEPPAEWGAGKLLLELYEKTTERELSGPVFVTDWPVEVSPLARRHRDDPDLVERFEPVIAGREIGNAFSELVDPDEQRARFVDQARQRAAGDEEAMILDEDYLWALEQGLPPTAGLGLGVDRLVMLLAGVDNIREVIAFPTLRPGRDELT